MGVRDRLGAGDDVMFALTGIWSIVARVAAYALVAAAVFSYGYVKGSDNEQDKQAVILAKQADVALQLAARHASASAKVLADRERDRNEVNRTNPDVADVIAAGRVCPPDKGNRARVPAAPAPGAATGLRPAGSPDRAAPEEVYDCTEDVQACRALTVDYRKLRALWHANEAEPDH